jgi:hypothetical protein
VAGLLWDDVSAFFEPDGSLLDAYVFDTAVSDWQAFIDLVRSRGWWFEYQEDSRSTRLPDRVGVAFDHAETSAVLLRVRPVPRMSVHVHFFTVEELEVDFAREEVQGQDRLDVVCGFLRAVSRRLSKPMVLTPENMRDDPLIGYDLAADRVVQIAR